ncbi:MAG: FAD-binding domain-containing protein, partial [Pseudomonadota bacterium]
MMESFDFGAPSARDGGFPPGRAAGLARLEAFAPRAGRAYRDARNTDPGPGRPTGVSRLSPYVRGRLVLEEEALAAALARHAPSACEKFVQEVFWRGYFKGWLEHRPEVWDDYVEERDAARAAAAEDARLGARLAAAQEGRTGVACFDAWIAELIETGWLHNHARMWTASIWIFTLELPWALGADLFMRHLVDADPASNTLSWRWVGGLHTRGKTYLARASNIAKHTNGRFRPGPGELAPDAPPLEGPPNPSAEPIPPADPAPAGRVFLLATEDEGRIEHLVAESGAAAEAVGVGALISAGRRSPEPLGAP